MKRSPYERWRRWCWRNSTDILTVLIIGGGLLGAGGLGIGLGAATAGQQAVALPAILAGLIGGAVGFVGITFGVDWRDANWPEFDPPLGQERNP